MLLAALLMPLAVAAQTTSFDAKYVLVISDANPRVASEDAARTWFTSTYGSQGQVLTVSDLSTYTLDPSKQKAVWVHLDQGDDQPANITAFSGTPATNLSDYVKAGGSMFLSLHAGALIGTTNGIGRVPDGYAPNKYIETRTDINVRGIRFKGFDNKDNTGHAIFANMTAVDYEYPLINATSNTATLHEYLWELNKISYTSGSGSYMDKYQEDTNSKVLGTWTHVSDAVIGGLIEFKPTDTYKGTIIVMGEGCYAWESTDKYPNNMELFTQNVMGYLKDKTNDVVPPSGTAINEKYVMVVSDNYASITAENNAVTWFTGKYGANGKVITASEVAGYSLDPKKNKAVWVHFNQATTVSSDGVTVLRYYMKNGGNLLLTKYASDLLADMDRIGSDYKANITVYRDDSGKGGGMNVNINNGAVNGNYLHSSHPAFDGLLSGGAVSFELVSNGYQDGVVIEHSWDFNAISGHQDTPNVLVDYEAKTNSIVLGTWTSISDFAVGAMIEYLPQSDYNSRTAYKGRAIAIGAGCYAWNANDKVQTGGVDNIKILTDNCIKYLEGCTNRQLSEETMVAYLLPQDLADGFTYDQALAAVDQDDERTALQWFIDDLVKTGKGVLLCPKDLADLDPSYVTTMWVHIDRDGGSANIGGWGTLSQDNMKYELQLYVENGGNLLLTKHAVQLVSDNGIKRSSSSYPLLVESGNTIEKNNTMWGINAVIGAGFRGDTRIAGDGERTSGDAFDHRKHYLYQNMTVDNSTYPEANAVDNRYEVFQIIGGGVKENHNCIWNGISVINFQNDNGCTVLGAWGQITDYSNAVVVDFEPFTKDNRQWEGHILCIGLGAYEWQQNVAGEGGQTAADNPYLPNIKQLTYNALNVLEHEISTETVTFTIGGVTYLGTATGATGTATILDAVSTLEKYDLVGSAGSNPLNGEVTYDNKTYTINSIALGAFMKCTNLAYADIMAFGATITSNPRPGIFPEHTLIYLPTTSEVKGQNIVNTQNSTKTCEDLKVFDKKYWANKYAFTTRKMSYTRDYTTEAADAEKYKTTVALPFPIDRDHAAEFGLFYKFNGVKDGTTNYKLVASTEAYQPYMFKPKASAIGFTSTTDVTIRAFDQEEEVATSSTEGGQFIARYKEGTFYPANNYQSSYVIYAYKKGTASEGYNTLLTTKETIGIYPFRVYLKTPKAANSARMLLMTFDDSEDQPTEIDGITTQPALGAQPVYDLSGRRIQLGADLSRLTRGIYIIGGRKVVIK